MVYEQGIWEFTRDWDVSNQAEGTAEVVIEHRKNCAQQVASLTQRFELRVVLASYDALPSYTSDSCGASAVTDKIVVYPMVISSLAFSLIDKDLLDAIAEQMEDR